MCCFQPPCIVGPLLQGAHRLELVGSRLLHHPPKHSLHWWWWWHSRTLDLALHQLCKLLICLHHPATWPWSRRQGGMPQICLCSLPRHLLQLMLLCMAAGLLSGCFWRQRRTLGLKGSNGNPISTGEYLVPPLRLRRLLKLPLCMLVSQSRSRCVSCFESCLAAKQCSRSRSCNSLLQVWTQATPSWIHDHQTGPRTEMKQRAALVTGRRREYDIFSQSIACWVVQQLTRGVVCHL